MSEEEARAWVRARFPASVPALERLVAMVTAENSAQNLVSPATLPAMWSRHVADSLQLVPLAKGLEDGTWLDVGTGGGFPGLAVAAVWDAPVVLVEPRRRRADFLSRTADALGLARVTVEQRRVEKVKCAASVVSARAVATVPALVAAARHIARPETRWLLPRGRHGPEDGAELRRLGFVFHVEHSLTAADSSIVVLPDSKRLP